MNYQKLYVYLVGEIDSVLEAIEANRDTAASPILLRWTHTKLQEALLTAEEMYIDA